MLLLVATPKEMVTALEIPKGHHLYDQAIDYTWEFALILIKRMKKIECDRRGQKHTFNGLVECF